MGQNPEPRQTFEHFTKQTANKVIPSKIYLVRIGSFTPLEESSFLESRTYLYAFFGIQIDTLADMEISSFPDSTLLNKKELISSSLLSNHFYLPDHTDSSGYLTVGMTPNNILPDPKLQYAFGQASFEKNCAIVSTHKFPTLKNGNTSPYYLNLRTFKTLTHETAHLIGLQHCQTYECNMNGNLHLQELDSKPVWLCPECLQKLHWILKLNPINRLENLQAFWEKRRNDLIQSYYQRALSFQTD